MKVIFNYQKGYLPCIKTSIAPAAAPFPGEDCDPEKAVPELGAAPRNYGTLAANNAHEPRFCSK